MCWNYAREKKTNRLYKIATNIEIGTIIAIRSLKGQIRIVYMNISLENYCLSNKV